MESLLRYSLMNIAVLILTIEIVVLLLFASIIIIVKTVSDRRRKEREKIKVRLSEIIQNALITEEIPSIPPKLQKFDEMIEVLEAYDHRISDDFWKRMKNDLIHRYLLAEARDLLSDRSWRTRHLAARCFQLNPAAAGEEELLKLLEDPHYMVRIIGGTCVTKVSNHKLFVKLIEIMSRESTLARFPYRDAIIQSSSEKYAWLREMLREKPAAPVAEVILDLLSTRTTEDLFTLIMPYLYGENKECKLLAVKILKSIPSTSAEDIFSHCLKDPNWEVRSEVLKTIADLNDNRFISHIEPLLHDPVWFVRLQAAIALKKLGGKGMDILWNKRKGEEPLAHDVAEYILALPD